MIKNQWGETLKSIQKSAIDNKVRIIEKTYAEKKQIDRDIMKHLSLLCQEADPKRCYKDLIKIGHGASGIVYRGRSVKSGQIVALKNVSLANLTRKEMIINEILIHRSINHPNIANYIESFIWEGEIWIVMEYVDGELLTKIVNSIYMTEEQMGFILKNVLFALSHLHDSGVMHRDIKSDNILISKDGTVKLFDFGQSATFSSVSPNDHRSSRSTLAGTPYWMAPEMINNRKYCTKVDVWSVGILLIELLDGEPPYLQEHPIKALHLISKNGVPDIQNFENTTPLLKDFLESCLQVDPILRADVKSLLCHPFLKVEHNNNCLKSIIGRSY